MLINNKSLIKTINKLNLTDDEREKFNKIGEDDNGNFIYNGKPVTGGATEEQIAQIQANKTAIGDENSGLVKEVNNIKNTELQNLNTAIQTLETLVGVDETVGDKTGLPSGDANIIASINRIDSKPSGTVTDEQISTAVNNYLTEHPVASGATAAQAAQIEANKTAIQTVNETIGNKNELPVGDTNIIASINRIDSKASTGGTGLTSEQEAKLNSIDNKVDKINGKGLSTNDYTTEEKTTLSNLKTVVGDTSSGLVKDVNNIKNAELQNLNTAIQRVNETVGNKSGLPSGDANIIASINRIDSSSAKTTDLNNKVDKVEGKTLTTNDYTNEEKQTVASLKATVGDTSSGLVKDVKDLKTNGVSQDNINVAIENYLTEHPIQSGATTEQAAQIEANTAAIGTEELPTTAKTLKGAIAETFQSVSSGKTLIASAITDKGVTTSNNDTFQTMANNIKSISGSQSQPSSDPYRENRTLIWEDDFNGSSINNENWSYELGYVRGSEMQYFTNSSKNAYVDGNSNLVIKAIKERVEGYKDGVPHAFGWTSASLFSNNKQEFLYGRIEAKIKLPNVKGQFPAFWTMGANYEYNYNSNDPEIRNSKKSIGWPKCGEIDIMEQIGGGTSTSSALHYGGDILAGEATGIDMSKFNIYSAEWTSEKIEFFVNDIKTGEASLSNTGNCFKLPHFILIGMSIGGQVAPAPDESTPQSFEMLVDWIRVYAPEDYGYGNFSLSKDYYETPTIGTYEQLSPVFPYYFPNTTINWNSSNENVATVTGGRIFTTGIGECDIIARLKNNYSAICKCKVIDPSDDNARTVPPYFWDYGCTLETNKLISVKNSKTLTLSDPSILSTESLILNGVDNKIKIDKINDSISQFSLHCIFKVTDLSKNNYIISDMSEGNKFNMTIRPSDNRLSVSIGNTAKMEIEYIPDNNFHHLGISVTTDGWTMIYIDGVKVKEGTVARHTLTDNMYMGYNAYFGNSGYSSGEYKCLYIYDSIPSSDDIKTIYDSLKLSYGIN